MGLTETENLLHERLKVIESELGYRVSLTPNDPDELRKPATDRIICGLQSRRLEKPSGIGVDMPVRQSGEVTFEVVIQGRNLRSHQGVLQVIDRVSELLTGFYPNPNYRKGAYETRSGFVAVSKGLWTYSMSFAVPVVNTKLPERRTNG